MKKFVIGGVVAGMALSSVAQAAVLSVASGDVRVNRGNGYSVVRGSSDLQPGDLVMLDGQSKAKLTYADGCAVSVRAGSVTAVGAKSPCSQMTAQAGPGGQAPAVLGVLLGNPVVLMGGALAVAGGAAAAVAVTTGGKGAQSVPILPIPPGS